MRHIAKGKEPAALATHRATPGATYDGADRAVKREIREALLRDQQHLCAYCMRRIDGKEHANPANADAPLLIGMKVEHWRSQSRAPELALAWTNLLGACLGGVGVPPSEQTCDTRKGDDAITLDPQNAAHIATLRCSTRGVLSSTNPTLQDDLDARLGLNQRALLAERKAVLDRAFAVLNARYKGVGYPPRAVRRAVLDHEVTHNSEAPPFCGTLRLWAQSRFGDALR